MSMLIQHPGYRRAALLGLILGLAACNTTPSSTASPGSGSNLSEPNAGDRSDTLAETNVKLGIGYLQQGQRELALSKLQRALALDPNLPSAHNAIAIVYEQLGERGLADQHYQRAVSLGPQDSSAHNNYGAFLCRNNQLDKAEEQFLLALNNPLYKSPESAYENAGLCALRAPNLPKAEKYFRSALQINPKLSSSLYQMAWISFEKQEYLPARGYLQRYSEVAKQHAQSLWLGIKIERVLGDKNAVASYSLLLRSNFPDSDEAKLLQESTGNTDSKSAPPANEHDES